MRTLAPSLAFAAALFTALAAQAQDGGAGCPDPVGYKPDEFFPASGAGNVATDAPLRIRYTPGSAAAIADPPTTLLSLEEGISGTRVDPSSVLWLGDTIVFRPAAPLRPRTFYTGTAIGPDGSNTFSFTTGTTTDHGAPTFGGTGIRTPTISMGAPTCDVPGGGFRVDVTVEQATDDAAPGDIEYLLFVTRAATVHAPTRVSHVRNFVSTTATIPMSFVIPPSEATARVCVAVLAVDDVGNVASSEQKCADPLRGNYFDGLCSVTAPRPASAAGAIVLLPALALAAMRRRRRRA